MTKYAYFDHTKPEPSSVLGWYDTEAFRYPNLPNPADLLEVTPEQWAIRTLRLWAVDGGTLVAYAPPVPAPTVAQQASAILAGGLTVTSASDDALDGTYPCDPAAQQLVIAEVASILLNGKFTDGADAFPWLDKNGAPHEFSVDQFKALATAILKFVTVCARAISGQSEELPAAEAEIP